MSTWPRMITLVLIILFTHTPAHADDSPKTDASLHTAEANEQPDDTAIVNGLVVPSVMVAFIGESKTLPLFGVRVAAELVEIVELGGGVMMLAYIPVPFASVRVKGPWFITPYIESQLALVIMQGLLPTVSAGLEVFVTDHVYLDAGGGVGFLLGDETSIMPTAQLSVGIRF